MLIYCLNIRKTMSEIKPSLTRKMLDMSLLYLAKLKLKLQATKYNHPSST